MPRSKSWCESVAHGARVTHEPGDLFLAEDWRSFGTGHDGHFRRTWRYCLSRSAAIFRTRRDQLWQLKLSPQGVRGGYRVPR